MELSWDISRIMDATWSVSHIAVGVIQNGVALGFTINGAGGCWFTLAHHQDSKANMSSNGNSTLGWVITKLEQSLSVPYAISWKCWFFIPWTLIPRFVYYLHMKALETFGLHCDVIKELNVESWNCLCSSYQGLRVESYQQILENLWLRNLIPISSFQDL